MSFVRELSVVRGWPDTLETFGEWRRRPRALLWWLLVSVSIMAILLTLVLVIANASPASPERPSYLPNRPHEHVGAHALALLRNNLVVLALHAVACFAGYVIYRAAHEDDEGWLGDTTRFMAGAAFLFVPCATLLSIGTQAWVLGSYASTASHHLGLTPAQLLRTALPHAGVELTAVFLPLAAWLVIRATGRPQQLLAATILSTLIALPLLGWAAWNEAYRWPARVVAMQAKHPLIENAFVGELMTDPTDDDSAYTFVSVGERAIDRSFDSVEAARKAAGPVSRTRAVIVVRTPDGVFVHYLVGSYHERWCEHHTSPMRRGSVRLDAYARFDRHAPRTERTGLELVEIVQGSSAMTVDAMTARSDPVTRSCFDS